MLKVVSVEKMRQIEASADASGFSYDQMMQNAGSAVAQCVIQKLNGKADARVTILVGPGNNGGDGLVAGRLIAQNSDTLVRFYLLKPRDADDHNYTAVLNAGIFIAQAEDDRDFRVLRNMVASADVVIDALFGIGVNLPLRENAARILRNVSQALNDQQQPAHPEGQIITPSSPNTVEPQFRPYVVAVDCPSGLNCDTGELDTNAIPADETVTFIAAKPGLLESPGAKAVGQLRIATIGIPPDLVELKQITHTVLDALTVRELLPTRSNDANKGTYGKALIVAGSINYTGAAGLSSVSAYRVGTGLVTVAAPDPVVAALSAQIMEVTWLLLPHDMGVIASNAAQIIQKNLSSYDAILLGPGWGRESTTREMLVRLLKMPEEIHGVNAKRSIGFASIDTVGDAVVSQILRLPSLVIDADALNILSEIEEWWTLLPEGTIITPHPGEMGRLAGMTTQEVLADRWKIAANKAAEWNVILVLKGAHTLVASPDGRVSVLPYKTDALSTGGTGDVLAGAITGLLAQGMAPYEACQVGTYIHALAGVLAATSLGNTRSVIASDVVTALSEALAMLESA